MTQKRSQGCAVASTGLKSFRNAGLTKVNSLGKEQFYIHKNEPDPQGRRVYCIVASDMSFNELVPLTHKEYMMFTLTKGEHYTVEDWTECFNIQPKDLIILHKDPIYGTTANRATFETLMQLGTPERI